MDTQHGQSKSTIPSVALPSPTAWPLVFAFGLTLLLAGLVTSIFVSLFGIILALCGSVGWFRQVLPHEQHELIPIAEEEVALTTTRQSVGRVSVHIQHRARLPVETPPVVAGLKGGIAGGIAMIIPAILYGLFAYHSIWYTVNLLGGAGVAGWTNPTLYQLTHFRLSALITASIIHIVISILVGLLYGAMLPMLPRHPILLGGIIAPVLWTGLMHSALGLINPYLDQRINWVAFVLSQVAFGLVAGWVVAHQTNIRTAQYLPFAARIGLETPGLMAEKGGEGSPEDQAR